jgi:hypothetical protein
VFLRTSRKTFFFDSSTRHVIGRCAWISPVFVPFDIEMEDVTGMTVPDLSAEIVSNFAGAVACFDLTAQIINPPMGSHY